MADLENRLDLAETLQELDPRERTIVTLKFYSDMSQSQIAERLGNSQMHVSRLQRRALFKLRGILDE